MSELQQRNCPVCGANASLGRPFLEQRIDKARINAFSYSSRKIPEYMCYTLLRCPTCDAVYACESPSGPEIADAYHRAAYNSKLDAIHAAESYEKALKPYLSFVHDRVGVLDIGTGTGIFLQCMRENGFSAVTGVEPSRAAIDAADDDIKPNILEGMFSAADFEPYSFTLISCFMALEHVFDPAALLRDCFHLLKPNGVMTVVVHNWRAWNNRLLGRRAPIIDIEHLQLFSKYSVHELFRRSGFVDIDCHDFSNRYRIDYWNRLLPTPVLLKGLMAFFLRKTGVGNLRLSMNVGNLMVVAHKMNR
ncbi:MAG: class I SAM-dependent methyltransferase [Pseudomonadota bacterium]